MKQIYLIAILISIPAILIAQNFKSTDEKEVYQTTLTISKAWTNNNLDSLEKYIAPGYTHTDVKGQLLDRKSWLQYVKDRKINSVVNSDVQFDEVKIIVHNDMAFVTGINIFSGAAYANEKDKLNSVQKIRFSQVLVKENHIWRRLLFQATYIAK
jgi:hypothetical protein